MFSSLPARLLALATTLLACEACSLENEGVDPPAATLNFPTAIAISPELCDGKPCRVYVANSNFDLRYNAGTVMAFDLAALDARIAACTAPPCTFEDTASFLAPGGERRIGSYASAIVASTTGSRIYVAVRSDGNLTYLDVDGAGGLQCGGGTSCDDAHRRGDDTYASERGLSMPGDPIAIASGSVERDLGGPAGSGDFLVVADSSGQVSLFLDRASGGGVAPSLVHVASGLPQRTEGAAFDAHDRLVYLPATGVPRLGRAGVALDLAAPMPQRSYVFAETPLRLANLSDGQDTRAVAFERDPTSPHRAYVVSRRPEALLVIDLDADGASQDEAALRRVVHTGAGPARVAVARFGASRKLFAFVSCFDGKSISVIDPDAGATVAVIRGVSGPFELVVDEARERLYVADFKSSVVRIVDVAGLADGRAPSVVATLGKPRPIETLR